jgi:hypothetical protein
MQKKRKIELTPYKRTVVAKVPPPETALGPVHVLDSLLVDDNREYVKKFTHLQMWQFFLLADTLRPFIARHRINMLSEKIGPTPKHDFYHHLYFAIKWLNDGAYH